jgi:hypothetical protein
MKISEMAKTVYDAVVDHHVKAMGRSGLKELAQILPAFPDSVRPVEEPGLAGNPVSHEVYEQRNPSVSGPTKEMQLGM